MHEIPQSAEEAAALIRRAPAEGWNLLATGTGAHLATGDADEGNMVRVETAGFAGIREHSAADMTVCVGAGTRLGELAEHLARAGQWLPIDPPRAEETTIGGLLAANLSGPLRASQGRARDLLLGIHTLDGRGDLIKGGGKVVKNVAGYDLPRLHIGACGGLGLILEATFQVRPRPEVEHAWVAPPCDAESAVALAFALRAAAEPGWLELAGSGVLAADGVTVVAGALGGQADVESAIASWRGIAAGGRLEENAAALRRRLADATAAADRIVLKAALLPNRLGALLAAAAEVGAAHKESSTLLAQATAGVARMLTPSIPCALAWIAALRGALEEQGGSLIVERAPSALRQALRAQTSLRGATPATIDLMRGVKASMDPHGVLAVGRLGWGI